MPGQSNRIDPIGSRVVVFAAVVAGVTYPFVLAFQTLGVEIAFRSFAADAYYYLAIADNSRDVAFFTFDGRDPTNGFHPLWGYLLTAAFARLPADPETQVQVVLALSVAFTAIGAALFALTLLRLSGRPALSLLAAVPGFYYLLLSTVDEHYGATWSFVNGMESPLSIFLFGVFLHRLVAGNALGQDSVRGIVTLSALASALVLTRLDDVFLLVPLVGLVALTAPSPRALMLRTLAAGLLPCVVLAAYLLYNHVATGAAFPTSGTAKLTPWEWRHSFTALLDSILPLFDRNVAWSGATWRVVNMTIPALVAAAWIAVVALRRDGRFLPVPGRLPTRGDQAVIVLAVYVVAKAGYNFVNVYLWNQGHWYYPLSIMTANLLLLLMLAHPRSEASAGIGEAQEPPAASRAGSPPPSRRKRAILVAVGVAAIVAALVLLVGRSNFPVNFGRYSDRRLVLVFLLLAGGGAALGVANGSLRALLSWLFGRGGQSVRRGFAIGATAVYMLLLANAFTDLKLNDPRGSEFYRFWARRDEIAAALERAGFASPLVECDDGIIAYSLPRSTMSGFALALDTEAFEYQRRLELLDIAWRRGARLIGSVWYARDWPDVAAADQETLRSMVGELCWGQRVDRWRFRVVLQGRDADLRYVFIAFEPAE